jgi:signal peptidase II
MTKNNPIKKKAVTAVIMLLLIAVDRLFKDLAVKYLLPVGNYPLISRVIRLNYVENTGAAFGSFKNNTLVLVVLTSVIVLAGIFLIYFRPLENKVYYVCAVMLVSGGIGNLIDRIINKYVIDYIEFLFIDFPVFNFADILVTVGSFLLAFYMIYEIYRDSVNKKQEQKNA